MVKNMSFGGYVYLIFEEDNETLYKIGVTRSKDVNKRLHALQTGNGKKLILKEAVYCDKPFKLEMMLHNRFSSVRREGEWFELTEDDLSNFKSICELYIKNIEVLKDNPFF